MSAPERPHDCAGDAAAFVLGALEPEERSAFEIHLESCVVCREEVSALTRVVDVLPGAVPQYRTPAELRARVLEAVRREAAAQAAEQAPERPRRLLASLWQSPPRWALATAGALAVAVIALAVALATAGNGAAPTRTLQAALTVRGTAEVRLSGGRAELILHHFPAPPRGEIYEVWLQRGASPPSPTTALFGPTTAGDADVGVSGVTDAVTRLMVTAEPAGGTQVPTSRPVLIARLD